MRAELRRWLRHAYFRIGIHAAPPGTLFHLIHSQVRRLAYRRIARYVTGDLFGRGPFGGTPYYDIWRARRTRQVDGLALVFFVGLGDYLFATTLIEALRTAHPGLLLHAHVSTHADAVNSPLVESLLRGNRYIDAVFTYQGRPRELWHNYDFQDCLRNIPRNFLIMPVLYSTHPAAYHRVTSLFESFGLPVRLPVPVPVLETSALTPAAEALLGTIRAQAARQYRGVIAGHFGTRSSNYLYPHRDAVIQRLIAAGFLIVTFSETRASGDGLVAVDVGAITPADTIEILRALQADTRPLYGLTVNSVLWPVTAGLGIPNLGLHIFFDPSVHQYVYPNTFVVSQYHYPALSPGRVYHAPAGSWKSRRTDDGPVLTDFDAGYVVDCFMNMVTLHEASQAA